MWNLKQLWKNKTPGGKIPDMFHIVVELNKYKKVNFEMKQG